jgi:hypothetical protein
MRIRTTIILVAITLGLFLYMYRVEIVGGRKEKEALEIAKKVMPYDADSVKVVRVRTGEGLVMARRIEDGWEITDPVKTKGDKGEIDNLLENLTGTSIERDLEETPPDLSVYGLSSPSVAVQVEGEGFSSDTLSIGEKNPTNTFVFAKWSGTPNVFLLPQVARSQLEKTLFNLRDKKILDVEREEVAKFTIDGPHGRITCEKKGEEWYLTEPLEDKADQGSVSRVLSSVASGKATGFAAEKADDLRKFGLDEPRASVMVFTGPDMVKHTLTVGEEEDRKVYAKDASRDPVFEMSRVFFESIDQEVQDFRNKKVMDFERTEVTSIEIKTPQETVVCERDTASNWFVMRAPTPEKVPAKKAEIDKLLSNLTTLRVEEFVEEKPVNLSPYGLDRPKLEVAVSGEAGEIVRLFLGSEKEEKVYARNNLRETVYLVRKRSADNLGVKYGTLKEEEKKDEGGAPAE